MQGADSPSSVALISPALVTSVALTSPGASPDVSGGFTPSAASAPSDANSHSTVSTEASAFGSVAVSVSAAAVGASFTPVTVIADEPDE